MRRKEFAVIGQQGPVRRFAKGVRLFQYRIEHRGEIGELLMTCNTWAVAVCCSKASRVAVRSRAFSIAITAWAAKFSSSAICWSVNGRTSRRAAAISPRNASSFRSGTKSTVRMPESSAALRNTGWSISTQSAI